MSSSSSSNLRNALEDILKIVYAFIAKREAEPFKEPLDWKANELFDYPDVVKHPMDLGTLKDNLRNNVYSSIDDAARDMRLIWTNCMSYNQDGSEYYHLADTFAKTFENKYVELRKKYGFNSCDPGRIPTMDEKIRLSYDLFRIAPEQLARTLTMIEKSCPQAVTREMNKGTEEALISMDLLSPTCFHEVAGYVKSCEPNETKGKRKRSGGGPPSKKATK